MYGISLIVSSYLLAREVVGAQLSPYWGPMEGYKFQKYCLFSVSFNYTGALQFVFTCVGMQLWTNRKRACTVHFHPSLSSRPCFQFFRGSGSETSLYLGGSFSSFCHWVLQHRYASVLGFDSYKTDPWWRKWPTLQSTWNCKQVQYLRLMHFMHACPLIILFITCARPAPRTCGLSSTHMNHNEWNSMAICPDSS